MKRGSNLPKVWNAELYNSPFPILYLLWHCTCKILHFSIIPSNLNSLMLLSTAGAKIFKPFWTIFRLKRYIQTTMGDPFFLYFWQHKFNIKVVLRNTNNSHKSLKSLLRLLSPANPPYYSRNVSGFWCHLLFKLFLTVQNSSLCCFIFHTGIS